MASRLEIYKGALRHLGNAAGLSSLTEVSPARSALDDAWQSSVDFLLEKGLWNFAIRTVELAYDEDTEPLFGYEYSYSKPTDWVRLVNIADEPTFREGLADYADENNYWYADCEPLYLRYVSNDDAYGWNVGSWRQSFAKCLEAYLAFSSSLPISASISSDRICAESSVANISGALMPSVVTIFSGSVLLSETSSSRTVPSSFCGTCILSRLCLPLIGGLSTSPVGLNDGY